MSSRLLLVTALVLVAVGVVLGVRAATGPHPTRAQVEAVLERVPANTFADRIACHGGGATWTCMVVGPGDAAAQYDVHVNRDGSVSIPADDNRPGPRVCCVAN